MTLPVDIKSKLLKGDILILDILASLIFKDWLIKTQPLESLFCRAFFTSSSTSVSGTVCFEKFLREETHCQRDEFHLRLLSNIIALFNEFSFLENEILASVIEVL